MSRRGAGEGYEAMSEPAWDNLRWEVQGATAWLVIDRPERLNALDRQTVSELHAAVRRAIEVPEVRVIAITGGGEKAFVAGADISEMSGLGAEAGQAWAHELHACLGQIERSPKPVIAAIRGYALGGGCELALACHLRVAATSARFAQPEVGLGLIPGAGGTQRLPRIVGRGRALDLILRGETIDAEEALRIGLVTRVVPPAELRDVVESLAVTLSSRSPLALARALEAVLVGSECGLDDALRMEAALFGLCFASEDMREGTRAFLEKRKPVFTGR